MSRLVAVTGATGFLGNAIVNRLRADGWSVRILVRRPLQQLPGIEQVEGHLLDRPALERLLEDTDAVIHCAGRVRGANAADFQRTNCQGTACLVDVAAALPHPPRFLHISSLAAREPGLSWYAASKHEAERLLAERAGAMPYTIFRPTAVHGPGDQEIRPLFTAMRYGILPLPGLPEARLTLLHVDDLVRAVRAWLTTATIHAGPYELHDGTANGYDWYDIREIGQEILSRRIRLLPIPAMLLATTANVNLWLARIIGYAPMLTPGKIRELRHPDWRCDNSAVNRDLDWHPENKFADSLRQHISSLAA